MCVFLLFIIIFTSVALLPFRPSFYNKRYLYIYLYTIICMYSLSLYTYMYILCSHTLHALQQDRRGGGIYMGIFARVAVLQWISRFFPLFSFLFHSSFSRTTPVFIIIIMYGGDDYYKCMTVEEIVQYASRASTHVTLWSWWLQVGGRVAKKKGFFVIHYYCVLYTYILLYMCV